MTNKEVDTLLQSLIRLSKDDKFTTQNNLSETKENKSPYTPIGTVKTFGNPKTELRDDVIVIAVTLIILSLVMLMLSCFN